MKNHSIYIKTALRFRRFTRAAYAAFVSLSREVSIGKLAVSIAISADKKTSGFFNEIVSFLKIQNEEKDELIAETQTVDILLFQTQTLVESAAACSIIHRAKYCGG